MPSGRPLDIELELLEAFRENGRINEYLVGVLPAALWFVKPEQGRGRSLAHIAAHMQSVRRTLARLGGAMPGPPTLDRLRSTQKDAARALGESTAILAALFETALRQKRVRVKGMPRRIVSQMFYLIQHDAHHRGQMCTLARDLGHDFSTDDKMRFWGWKALPPR